MAEIQAETKAGSFNNNYASDYFLNLSEKTLLDSPEYPAATFEKPYNPDELYRKKFDYSIYEEMLKDDQVIAVSQLKKDIILGSGFDIVSEDEADEKIKEDIEMALSEDLEKPFESYLEELLSCHDFGFSLSEKIFKYRDDGTITLECLKTRHPNTWRIYTDKYGNIEKYCQTTIEGHEQEIDGRSLIHMVNNPKFQNPYGTSDLRAAYAAYFVKLNVVRYYAIFLEKAASPTPVAKFDKDAPASAVDKIFNALKKLQVKTALTIPKNIDVEFLESKQTGVAYQEALSYYNMMIGRAVLIPDLMGFSGDKTQGGSFALGENQMDVFFKHIHRRRLYLEKIIDNHIIKPIVIHNWGFVDQFPKFKFKPIKETDKQKLAEIFLKAAQSKLYKPSDEEINYFREAIGYPTGEVDREEIQAVSEPSIDPKQNPKPEDKKQAEETEKYAVYLKPKDSDFHSRVDFKALSAQLDSTVNSVLAEAKPILDDIFEKLIDRIKKKKILENKQLDKIPEIKVERKRDINLLLKRSFKELYKKSRVLAESELLKQNFAKYDIDEEFLKFIDEETFQYVGEKWGYNIEQGLWQDMRRAIRDGDSLASVIEFTEGQSKKQAEVTLDRYVRTKTTEVMNRARKEYFDSTGLVSGYQFSAIMDNRTSAICAGLHGKKFKAGMAPIPPLHFNCRSILIPITRFEEFQEDKRAGGTVETAKGQSINTGPTRSIQEFIKENLGEGFSVK